MNKQPRASSQQGKARQSEDLVPLRWLLVFLTLAILEGLLLWKLLTGPSEVDPALIAAICVIAALLLVSFAAERLEEIGLGTFSAKLARVEQRADELNDAITQLVLGSMGPETYKNLRKIANGRFGPFVKPHHMGLETELYHLRNLGYIELIDGAAPSVFDIPCCGDELCDYVAVTGQGRRYLDLREGQELGRES